MSLTVFKISMFKTVVVIVVFINVISTVENVSLDEDLTLTTEEKRIVDQFRDLVGSKLPFGHEYMTKDIYLVRWLRARNFKIELAEQMLLMNLEWRYKNKMDSIMEEDFSDMEQEFKYYINTYEKKDGQTGVMMYGDLANWDVRRGVLQGKTQRMIRYLDRYLEIVTSKVRTLQEAGHNITQYDFCVNMQKFNLIQHGCLQCISALTVFILHYENYYPAACNKMYMVNTPANFEIILNAVKGVLSPLTRQSLEIHGTNKQQWQQKLFSDIPRQYLPPDVGGTKIFEDYEL